MKNAQERTEQARQKPTFVMEALEPRILLSATWVGTDQNGTLYGGAGDDVHSQFELPPTRASSDGTRLDPATSVEAGATAAETFQYVDADLDRAAGLDSQAAHRGDPDASDDAGHDESVQALHQDRGHTQSAQQRGGMGAEAGQWLAGLWGMVRGLGRRENEGK